MKYAYAFTLCLSGMMGADAFVLPAGAAPKSGYALQRPNDNVANQNAAGTAVKFSPNQGSTATKSGTIAGFIPVKGLAGGPSKRHALYMREAQPDDDADADDDMTTFSAPALRIGTLKQADSGDDTKSVKVNNKKQNGKTKSEDKKKIDDEKKADDDKTKNKGSDDKKTDKKADKKTDKKTDDKKTDKKADDSKSSTKSKSKNTSHKSHTSKHS
ncbi:hypothetical protein ACHAQI_005510 [Fusarium lateritium]